MKQSVTKLLICFCLLIFNVTQSASAQTRLQDEQLVKAAFIYNFAKFTRWPESTPNEAGSPLRLCTEGEDALIAELTRLAGKRIHERPVTVQALDESQPLDNCHLLYIAGSEINHYKKLLKSLSEKPVLTISEVANFASAGGIIELYREKNQISFTINLTSARKAGLVLSSRLLNLAKIIDQEDAQ